MDCPNSRAGIRLWTSWRAGSAPPCTHARATSAWRGGRTPTLLHGDYWPGNLLWRGNEIVALLDWEDAALGDPLSDLAAARVELCCAKDEAVAARFTDHHLKLTGLDAEDLHVWDLYVSGAALATMDDWGLASEVLEHRRRTTLSFFDRALTRLLAG